MLLTPVVSDQMQQQEQPTAQPPQLVIEDTDLLVQGIVVALMPSFRISRTIDDCCGH